MPNLPPSYFRGQRHIEDPDVAGLANIVTLASGTAESSILTEQLPVDPAVGQSFILTDDPASPVIVTWTGSAWSRIPLSSGDIGDPAPPPNLPISGLIEVREKSDFGTFVAGVATLITGNVYQILQPIDLGTDRLQGHVITFVGNDSFQATISCSSSSALYSSDGSGFLRANGVTFQNNNGPIWNLNVGTGPLDVVVLTICFFTDQGGGTGGSFGTVEDSTLITIHNCFFILLEDGLVVNGDSTIISLSTIAFVSKPSASAYRAIRFGAASTFDAASITNCQFTTFNASDKCISVDNGTTISLQVRANSCIFNGIGEFIDSGGKDKTHPDVITVQNTADVGNGDSAFIGEIFFTGNDEVTSFAMSDTAYPIGQGNDDHTAFALDAESERFILVDEGSDDFTRDQVIQYEGKVARKYRVIVETEMDKGGGGSLTIGLSILRNGSLIPNSRTPTEVTSASTYAATSALVTLNPGDKIRPAVDNVGSTADITVLLTKVTCDPKS